MKMVSLKKNDNKQIGKSHSHHIYLFPSKYPLISLIERFHNNFPHICFPSYQAYYLCSMFKPSLIFLKLNK